jgi:hypothetical protein
LSVRRPFAAFAVLLVLAGTGEAQSLFVVQGERAVEGSAAWSVGPSSNGLELAGAASLDGRWDVGFGVNRYVLDLGGANDGTLTEWSPFARYFLFKESDDATPVSLAVHAQYVADRIDGRDGGWYVLGGGQLFKRLSLDESFALYPFLGFAVAAESFEVGGGADPDRSVYLTRQFGVHGLMTLTPRSWLRVTVEEQSFRRETYRAVRVAYGRRF